MPLLAGRPDWNLPRHSANALGGILVSQLKLKQRKEVYCHSVIRPKSAKVANNTAVDNRRINRKVDDREINWAIAMFPKA